MQFIFDLEWFHFQFQTRRICNSPRTARVNLKTIQKVHAPSDWKSANVWLPAEKNCICTSCIAYVLLTAKKMNLKESLWNLNNYFGFYNIIINVKVKISNLNYRYDTWSKNNVLQFRDFKSNFNETWWLNGWDINHFGN